MQFMTPRYAALLLIAAILSPAIIESAVDFVFVHGSYTRQDVNYSPECFYYDGPLTTIEATLIYVPPAYVCTYAHSASLGISGVYFTAQFSNALHNVRKIVLNLTFTSAETNWKHFEHIRLGFGTGSKLFTNLSEKRDCLSPSYGRCYTFHFDVRDYIEHENTNADYLIFDLGMNDDGSTLHFWNNTDTITFDVRVYTTDIWKYWNVFRVLMVCDALVLLYVSARVMSMKMSRRDMIF